MYRGILPIDPNRETKIKKYINQIRGKDSKTKKKKKKRSKNSLGSKRKDSGIPKYLQISRRMRLSTDKSKLKKVQNADLHNQHNPSSSLLVPRVDRRHNSRMSLIEVLDKVIDSQLSNYSEEDASAFDSKVSKKSSINQAEEKDKIKYKSLNTNADILCKELYNSKKFIEDIAGK